mmetsp:Transcript_3851/g.11482  ORF Transcript_3851/g.11482 Transcript_3851/m.11482 type:complete len:470 (-) Transcript_3851:329-1738(-)
MTEALGKIFGELRQYDANIVHRAKSKCRTDITLAQWTSGKYFLSPNSLREPAQHGTVPRVHTEDLSIDDFIRVYEIPNLPVLIDGIVQEWPAWQNWDLKKLYKRYRHTKFRVGDDDDGYAVRVKLKYFLRYMLGQKDDSPLYIFDSRFPKHNGEKKLLDDYEIPKYFKEDLFRLVGEKRRPPYRWFLIGPKRSGSNVHIDPLGTSAWNALISGRKRWILFPPHVPKKVVKGKRFKLPEEDDEPIDYFTNILPRLKAEMGESLEYIEFVQYPGETIFVPGGWWHAVLNLDDTVAVTQNFVSSQNFQNCWIQTRKGRRGMARLWHRKLKEEYPELAQIADRLNRDHGYRLEEERRKHHEEYRKNVIELKERRRAEKARRAASGDFEDRSSSMSDDLVDSDWTSLSDSFSGLSDGDDMETVPSTEIRRRSEALVDGTVPLHASTASEPPLLPPPMPILGIVRSEVAPMRMTE